MAELRAERQGTHIGDVPYVSPMGPVTTRCQFMAQPSVPSTIEPWLTTSPTTVSRSSYGPSSSSHSQGAVSGNGLPRSRSAPSSPQSSGSSASPTSPYTGGPWKDPSDTSATNVRYGSGSTTPCSASKACTAAQPRADSPPSSTANASRRAASSAGSA